MTSDVKEGSCKTLKTDPEMLENYFAYGVNQKYFEYYLVLKIIGLRFWLIIYTNYNCTKCNLN